MKLKDIRISNTSEIKSFLMEEKVSFPQNSTLDQLRSIARSHIEKKEATPPEAETAQPTEGTEPAPTEPEGTEPETTEPETTEPEQGTGEQGDSQPVDPETLPANSDATLSEIAPQPPEPTPPAPQPTETKPAAKGKGRAAAKTEEKKPDLTQPGARRELPLGDLLDELAKRGFQHKQELADLLEATFREQKWLTHLKNEHKEREEKVAAEEIKLQQRIADFEVNAKKIHADKDEAARMLDEAVRIRDEIAKKTK